MPLIDVLLARRRSNLVRHQHARAVGGNEGHHAIAREARQTHARVKAVLLDQVRVAQGQVDVRHPAQSRVDFNPPVHRRRQHLALRVNRRVDGFDEIQINLIARVLDIIRAPRQREQLERILIAHDDALIPHHRRRDAIVQVRRRHQHLQPPRVRVHRYPTIQHLIQQLIQRHVVLLQRRLRDALSEVRAQHVVQLRQEFDHHQRRRLPRARRHVRHLASRQEEPVRPLIDARRVAVHALALSPSMRFEHPFANLAPRDRAPVLHRDQRFRAIVHDEQRVDPHRARRRRRGRGAVRARSVATRVTRGSVKV